MAISMVIGGQYCPAEYPSSILSFLAESFP